MSKRHQIVFAIFLYVSPLLFCQLSKQVKNDGSDVYIRLERFDCSFDCRNYSIEIFGDGRVEYQGIKNVRLKGKAKGRIPGKDLGRLIKAFDNASFFSLRDTYTSSPSKEGMVICLDNQINRLTYRRNGKNKRITDDCGTPYRVIDLEALVDQIVRSQQWLFYDSTTLKMAIQNGLNLEKEGPKIVSEAIEWDDAEIIQMLYERQIRLDPGACWSRKKKDIVPVPMEECMRSEDGIWEQPFLKAVSYGAYKCARLLLTYDFSPRQSDAFGQNALHRIQRDINADFIRLLVDRGVDVNARSSGHWTPLMHAAGDGNYPYTKLLIELGADLSMKNDQGQTALDLAIETSTSSKYWKYDEDNPKPDWFDMDKTIAILQAASAKQK